MSELLSGVEGQFRTQGPEAPGTSSTAGGLVPGATLSVSEALDTDLDAYLDRELFVGSKVEPGARGPVAAAVSVASGDMRALLNLAEKESEWLETLPAPAPPTVEPAPEPKQPEVVIPEWMRVAPGAKETLPLAAMLTPVAHDAAEVRPEAVRVDAAGLPTTPWSVPVSAPVPYGNLLPGIAPSPAAPEPMRIAGMRPGAFLGAAAVGALAAGLLVVAGLHLREHVTGTPGAVASTRAGGQELSSTATGGLSGTGTAHEQTPVAQARADASGSPPLPGLAVTARTDAPEQTGEQGGTSSASGLVGTVQASASGQMSAQGENSGTRLSTALAGAALPEASGPVFTQGATPGMPLFPEWTGTLQASGVPGPLGSQSAHSGWGPADSSRASQPTVAPTGSPSVQGTALTHGPPATVSVREPSSRKPLTKADSTVPERTAASADEDADARVSELSFDEAGADEESTTSSEDGDTKASETATVSSAEARPTNAYSELDEDFARELGFTEDAEKKKAVDPNASRTVYIPPAPDVKQHLTPDDVKAVVVTNQPAITACLRQHAKGTPVEGGGRFMVRWSVLPSGDTSGVAMETDALRATPLARCIEDVVRRWKFPAHQVRMQEPIRFPFVF